MLASTAFLTRLHNIHFPPEVLFSAYNMFSPKSQKKIVGSDPHMNTPQEEWQENFQASFWQLMNDLAKSHSN